MRTTQEIQPKRTKDFGYIINVNKPAGKTSFDVVAYVRKLSGIKKVGHAGTLDPDASGVLLIVLGTATKQVENLMGLEKEYLTTIRLGVDTDTYDSSGKVVEKKPVKGLTRNKITSVLEQFEGEILQVPPPFSALKYKGKPLYTYARKGNIITPDARKVNVSKISLESMEIPDITVRVVCSRGTYIRSIAHDLGKKLGCGGIVYQLTRLRIGDYDLSNSVTWGQLPETLATIIKN